MVATHLNWYDRGRKPTCVYPSNQGILLSVLYNLHLFFFFKQKKSTVDENIVKHTHVKMFSLPNDQYRWSGTILRMFE